MVGKHLLGIGLALVTAFTAPAQGHEPGPILGALVGQERTEPLPLGVCPPAPTWGPWRRGAPVAFGGDAAPACAVFAFYPHGAARSGPDADADGDYLGDLQRRFADRGVRVIAAIADPELPLGKAWDPCSVVVDTEQGTARRWGVANREDLHVVVIDRDGRTVFQGGLADGLVDAVRGAVDGRLDLARSAASAAMREWFAQNFDDVTGAEVQPQVEAMLAHAPHDGLAWGVAYLLAATKVGDADQALAVRKRAAEALAGEWRPLAVFADLALRGDPRAPALGPELAAALLPATAAAPHDPVVQLAYLRALVVADRGRELGRHAARTAKLVQPSPQHNLEFAAILAQAPTPQVHRDLAQQAAQRAEALGAPANLLQAVQYVVARRCAEDQAAGKAILDSYVGRVGERVSLNNDCWYLMTRLPTLGRFDHFAAALAERMLEQRDEMDYFEFDTAALAMHLAGRAAEAVELQETAIQKGGAGNPEYAQRLRRYRAAAVPSPR